MSIKIIFERPVKYKGKKIKAKEILEINESEKVNMLDCGAFIVQEGLIGVNKKGEQVIIGVVPLVNEDNKQGKKEGKKEIKGRK